MKKFKIISDVDKELGPIFCLYEKKLFFWTFIDYNVSLDYIENLVKHLARKPIRKNVIL